ncbi:hypothetical protein IWZ03DRAFT_176393 [Phyllosticta citriasiana]|uniref:Uncharacterized protein n=1 Tax=Phyllosticta citriasiana TaxID=595635 RepID=A0ABR1KS23_9PEZI
MGQTEREKGLKKKPPPKKKKKTSPGSESETWSMQYTWAIQYPLPHSSITVHHLVVVVSTVCHVSLQIVFLSRCPAESCTVRIPKSRLCMVQKAAQVDMSSETWVRKPHKCEDDMYGRVSDVMLPRYKSAFLRHICCSIDWESSGTAAVMNDPCVAREGSDITPTSYAVGQPHHIIVYGNHDTRVRRAVRASRLCASIFTIAQKSQLQNSNQQMADTFSRRRTPE